MSEIVEDAKPYDESSIEHHLYVFSTTKYYIPTVQNLKGQILEKCFEWGFFMEQKSNKILCGKNSKFAIEGDFRNMQ